MLRTTLYADPTPLRSRLSRSGPRHPTPDLRRQYNDQVPVVVINGRKAFKYRMDEQVVFAEISQLIV